MSVITTLLFLCLVQSVAASSSTTAATTQDDSDTTSAATTADSAETTTADNSATTTGDNSATTTADDSGDTTTDGNDDATTDDSDTTTDGGQTSTTSAADTTIADTTASDSSTEDTSDTSTNSTAAPAVDLCYDFYCVGTEDECFEAMATNYSTCRRDDYCKVAVTNLTDGSTRVVAECTGFCEQQEFGQGIGTTRSNCCNGHLCNTQNLLNYSGTATSLSPFSWLSILLPLVLALTCPPPLPA